MLVPLTKVATEWSSAKMTVTDDVTVVKMMPSHRVRRRRRGRCDEDVDAVDAMKTWSMR